MVSYKVNSDLVSTIIGTKMEFSRGRFGRISAAVCFLIMLISLLPAYVKSQRVTFTASYNGEGTVVGIVGEPLDFICSTDTLLNTDDQVEIYFQGDLLLTFTNNNFVFTQIQPELYYETKVLMTGITSTAVITGVQLTIKKIYENNAGDYSCLMVFSGAVKASPTRNIIVKYFPKPTCYIQDNPYIEYFPNDGNGLLSTVVGITVNLFCTVQTGDSYETVTLEWSRDDNGMVSQSGSSGMASISFPSTSNEDSVSFICTSKSTTYADFKKSCTISVLVRSKDVSTAQAIQLPTSVFVDGTRKTYMYVNTSPTLVTENASTTRTASAASTTTSQPESRIPLALILGAGGAIGLLFLILIIIIICICVTRSSKREPKRPSTADDVQLVNQRPSQNMEDLPPSSQLPRYSVDSFDSVISDIDDERPKSRVNYENTDQTDLTKLVRPTLHNIEEEADQASSSLTTKPSKSRISYENSENRHFVLPPLQDSEQVKTSSGLRNFVAERDFKDSEMNNLNLATGINAKKMKNNEKNIPGTKPIENATDDPPVYADVKKNRNKGILSIASDKDDDIPTYAMVNKDRKSKTQSRVPTLIAYAYTEEATNNRELEESSLHYADVELSKPSSTGGARGRRSPSSSATYSSVPD